MKSILKEFVKWGGRGPEGNHSLNNGMRKTLFREFYDPNLFLRPYEKFSSGIRGIVAFSAASETALLKETR
jgi:hypothetical protein